jgi:tRNA A-37 threonylcarbamoyl transferase component Bud32
MNKFFENSSVRKLVESEKADEIFERINEIELEKDPIGEGGNAIIFIPKNEKLKGICIKKVKEKPQIQFNDIEQESKYQEILKKAGVNTPEILISIDTPKGKYFIMEKIDGFTVAEVVEKPSRMPEKFNYEVFCKVLDEQISIMHKNGIYHRDLHDRNIMINEEGMPVVIDFGTAAYGSGSDFTYEESVAMYNSQKGRYEFVNGFFKDDLEMVKNIKSALKGFMK